MNIREMIEQLEDLASEHGEEVEVRYASQPSYPFENSISQLVAVNLGGDEEGQESEEDNVIIYLAEGTQLGYLPGAVSETLGWR